MRERAAWGAFGVAALPLLALGLLLWPAWDDFGQSAEAREAGSPLAYAWARYLSWSGRATVEVAHALLMADLERVPLVGLLHTAAFAGLAVLMGGRRPLAALALLGALWFGAYFALPQSVYWATGGLNYVQPAAFGTLWLVGLHRVLRGEMGRCGCVLWVAGGLPLGLAHEQIGLALLLTGGLGVAWHRSRVGGAGIAVLGLGVALLLAAPGNAVRLATEATEFRPSFGSAQRALELLAGMAAPAGLFGIGAGVLVRAVRPVRVDPRWPLLLAVAGAGSLAPFLLLPESAIYARTAFAAAVWWCGAGFAAVACVPAHAPSPALRRVGCAAWLLAAAVYAQSVTGEVLAGIAARPLAWREIHTAQLAAEAGQPVRLIERRFDGTHVLPRTGLGDDPASWPNRTMAQYFRVTASRGHDQPAPAFR